MQEPGAIVHRLPGSSPEGGSIRLRIASRDEGPASERQGSHQNAARMRSPTRRNAAFDRVNVRHAKPPPFVTPVRARGARDQGRSPRRRGGSCRRGRKTGRPSDSSADSPGGMSSGRMRLLRRFDAGLRRRRQFEIRHARGTRQTATLGGKAHDGNRSSVRCAIHCGSERRCAQSDEWSNLIVGSRRRARSFNRRVNIHMRKCNTRPPRPREASAILVLGSAGRASYSTVTDFARLRGLSTSVPRITAAW